MKLTKISRIILTILSIIFCGGFSVWIITLFQGTGFLYAATLPIPILTCVVGFIFTTVLTIVIGIRNGFGDVKLETFLHLICLTLLTVLIIDDSELLKAKRIVTAYLRDDIGGMEMILRNNGTFEMNSIGPFLVTKKHSGKYEIKGDTIRFLDAPTTNKYLPTTALLKHADKRIYFNRTSTGQFDTTKTFLNYFELVSN